MIWQFVDNLLVFLLLGVSRRRRVILVWKHTFEVLFDAITCVYCKSALRAVHLSLDFGTLRCYAFQSNGRLFWNYQVVLIGLLFIRVCFPVVHFGLFYLERCHFCLNVDTLRRRRPYLFRFEHWNSILLDSPKLLSLLVRSGCSFSMTTGIYCWTLNCPSFFLFLQSLHCLIMVIFLYFQHIFISLVCRVTSSHIFLSHLSRFNFFHIKWLLRLQIHLLRADKVDVQIGGNFLNPSLRKTSCVRISTQLNQLILLETNRLALTMR